MTDIPTTARGQALAVLDAVLRRGHPLDEVLEALPGPQHLDTRDRAMAQRLAMAVLRRRGQIDRALEGRLTGSMPRQRYVDNILRIGAAELLFLEAPAYAAVDGCVDLAKQVGRHRHAGLVNAVLRGFDRERPPAASEALTPAQAGRINTPDWLWSDWAATYGAVSADAIAAAHLVEPPLDLTAKSDPEEWATHLAAQVLPTGTLRLSGRGPIRDLPGFADGAWWVQDAAAALPASLLGDVRGRPVLDLCAAPGGKTAQLAAAGAVVTAVDRSARRLARVRENLHRLDLVADLVEANLLSYTPRQLFASVLLDAPCSATGTIRRRPDIPYRRSPADIDRAAEIQRRMLRRVVEFVAPGGCLVYAVCSLQAIEGPAQIAALIADGAPVTVEAITADEIGGNTDWIDDGCLRTLPCHLSEYGGMDGFFAARLRRR